MLGDSEAHVLLSPKTCKSGLEQVSWFIIVPLCLTTAKKAPPPSILRSGSLVASPYKPLKRASPPEAFLHPTQGALKPAILDVGLPGYSR